MTPPERLLHPAFRVRGGVSVANVIDDSYGQHMGPVVIRSEVEGDVLGVVDVLEAVGAEGRWIGTEVPFDRDARAHEIRRALLGPATFNLPDGADPASWLRRFGPTALETWDTATARSAASVVTGCDPVHLPAL